MASMFCLVFDYTSDTLPMTVHHALSGTDWPMPFATACMTKQQSTQSPKPSLQEASLSAWHHGYELQVQWLWS